MVRSRLSYSTKVTEEEFATIEAQAVERGVNLSEWAREALLERLKPDQVPAIKSCWPR
jgi:hypothetical protein